MKVLKFGGRSLANGEGLSKVVSIIEKKIQEGERITVVVSARGKATDDLESILKKASKGEDYQNKLEAFKAYQTEPSKAIDFSEEFSKLDWDGIKIWKCEMLIDRCA